MRVNFVRDPYALKSPKTPRYKDVGTGDGQEDQSHKTLPTVPQSFSLRWASGRHCSPTLCWDQLTGSLGDRLAPSQQRALPSPTPEV